MSITRSNQNADEQSQIVRNAKKKSQQNFLKEQLSKKFFTKFGLDQIAKGSSSANRNSQAIMKIIQNQFEDFIATKELNQNSLQKFEEGLIDKIRKVLVKEGVIQEGEHLNRQSNAGSRSSRGPPLQMVQNNLAPRTQTAGNGTRTRAGRSLGVTTGISKENSLPEIGIRTSIISPANRVPSQIEGRENTNPNGSRIVSTLKKKGHINMNNLFQKPNSKLNQSYRNPMDVRNKSTDHGVLQRNMNMVRSIEVVSNAIPQKDQYSYSINLNNDAALRVKMGAQKKGGVDDSLLPNEISEDHWGDINNHNYQLYLEDEEKLKNEKLKKRNLVRDTLQKQLDQQDQIKKKRLQYNKNIDTLMLNNAKKGLDAEKKKAREQKKIVELQKVQRDVMLLESQARKMQQYADSREKEKIEVIELKKALEQEILDKADRKRIEREAALKVIKANEKDRERRLLQLEQEKVIAQKMLANTEAAAEKEEKKRNQEWQDRDRKIKEKLERMGDVMKKSNQAEKDLERRIMKDHIKKDQLAEQEDQRRNKLKREQLIEVKATLDKQVFYKQQVKQDQRVENQKYMIKINQRDEQDHQDDKKALIKHKNQIMDVAQFQKYQINQVNRPMDIGIGISKPGEEAPQPRNNAKSPTILSQSGGGYYDVHRKKREVEQMSIEELRINKKLIQEIAQKKKESSAQKSSSLM